MLVPALPISQDASLPPSREGNFANCCSLGKAHQVASNNVKNCERALSRMPSARLPTAPVLCPELNPVLNASARPSHIHNALVVRMVALTFLGVGPDRPPSALVLAICFENGCGHAQHATAESLGDLCLSDGAARCAVLLGIPPLRTRLSRYQPLERAVPFPEWVHSLFPGQDASTECIQSVRQISLLAPSLAIASLPDAPRPCHANPHKHAAPHSGNHTTMHASQIVASVHLCILLRFLDPLLRCRWCFSPRWRGECRQQL